VTDARTLDATDPLAAHRDGFVRAEGVLAYLDGNSLGRPLAASADRIATFITEQWGTRLIRGWDESWLDLPLRIGDDIGRITLGAAPGQTTIGDSTTVLLYKLVRAAVDARPGRSELVIDRDNFPTDRYVLEAIAAERNLTVRWIESADGVTEADVAAAVTQNTAVVVLSHVAYRSGYLADVPAITAVVHSAGALMLWDLCHSAGVVPTELDAWGVDLAVGCTYKYLNGGPGSPAFAYVRAELQPTLRQPIWGWLGSATPFEMGQGYEPAAGIRGFLSGTPPIVGMLALQDMLALIDSVGIDAVRAKSVALTEYALALSDELLPGVTVATPRDPELRGSHITLDDDRFADLMPELWKRGVIPDFRRPNGVRLGLSPLSTSFAEVEVGVRTIAELLAAR
jgi:kynureninase